MRDVIRVAGALDREAMLRLERAVRTAAQPGQRLVVDLSRVDHVDAHAASRFAAVALASRRAGCILLVVPPAAGPAESWSVAVGPSARTDDAPRTGPARRRQL